MSSASGSVTGSRVRIGLSAIRQNDITGAPHPFRAEARERLCVPVLAERGRREQLGGGDDALAAAAVESHLEHGSLRVLSYRRTPPAGAVAAPAGGRG